MKISKITFVNLGKTRKIDKLRMELINTDSIKYTIVDNYDNLVVMYDCTIFDDDYVLDVVRKYSKDITYNSVIY